MWVSRKSYESLVTLAAQSELLAKAEMRAEVAEAALTHERRERMSDVHRLTTDLRHFASMWLRHSGTYPLPPTAEEKAEAKVERENKPPPSLNADQLARREAVRQWAKANGYTEREADEKFAATMNMMYEE